MPRDRSSGAGAPGRQIGCDATYEGLLVKVWREREQEPGNKAMAKREEAASLIGCGAIGALGPSEDRGAGRTPGRVA